MRQALRLQQRPALAITAEMRQALRLLALPNLEIARAVAEEAADNPLVEVEEPAALGERRAAPAIGARFAEGRAAATAGGEERALDGVAAGTTLREHLLEQIDATFTDALGHRIATQLADFVDEAGYLRVSTDQVAESLGCPETRAEAVLARLQRVAPAGVCARDLRECLLLQLVDRGRLDTAMQVLLDNLELVARGERAALMRRCRVDDSTLDDMLDELQALDPKPGAHFSSEIAPVAIPDIVVTIAEEGWEVALNEETLPRLIINSAYRARVGSAGETRHDAYLADCFRSASGLARALHQRAETVLKVATAIARRQEDFLRRGSPGLRPLTLREIAEDVGLHESTVSRAIANKLIATPQGTFAIKSFFSGSLDSTGDDGTHAAAAVRQRIRALVEGEGEADVLSDDRLVELLRAEGVDIARRTVAKYRDALGIPSSTARRRAKRLRRRSRGSAAPGRG